MLYERRDGRAGGACPRPVSNDSPEGPMTISLGRFALVVAALALAAACQVPAAGGFVVQEGASAIRRAMEAGAESYAIEAYNEAQRKQREALALYDQGREAEARRLFEEARVRADEAIELSKEKASIAEDCAGALRQVEDIRAQVNPEDVERFAPNLGADAAAWTTRAKTACDSGDGAAAATPIYEADRHWRQVVDAVRAARRFPNLEPGTVFWLETFHKCALGPGKVPEFWDALIFPSPIPTTFSMEKDGENCALRAIANSGALAIYRFANADPLDYPILQWRWRVWNGLPNGDISRLVTNDAPARIFVAFGPPRGSKPPAINRWQAKVDTGIFPPGRALIYAWANRVPKGSVVRWPADDDAKQIVVESGNLNVGRWQTVRRNVVDDYRGIWNEDPPPISYLALLTDGDQTFGRALTLYDDIAILAE